MTRAYNEGHYAGFHGDSEESNPYDHTTEHSDYWDWYGGFKDGELDAEEEGFK